MTRRASAVVAMLTGALAGALLLKVSLVLPLVVAAALALVTWLVYIPAARRSHASSEPSKG
jgi:type IV secretory pathway TrbD component